MIKVGGSLCEPKLLAPLAVAIGELAKTCSVTVIPGGGPFANLVRHWDRRLSLSDSASHWMAVAAMNQYGLLLESQGMGTAVDDPAMLFSPSDVARIFLPYRFLRDTDPLPHTWSVTSDSIAAYLASLFSVDRLILLKPTDSAPASPCPASLASSSEIMDRYFDRYLSENTECWIVNGKEPQRLLDLQNFGCPGTSVIPCYSKLTRGD
jgi:aspartokinase-like uncharacterized kinase